MKAASLPARIAYAAVAVPLGGAAGFYSCMRILPAFTANHPQLDPAMDGSVIFNIAVFVGAVVASTASLFVLTLPWVRRRKLRGRAGRIGFSCFVVLLCSVVFADQGFGYSYDLAFIAWLTYTMTFSFVRYGVLDQARRSTSTFNEY